MAQGKHLNTTKALGILHSSSKVYNRFITSHCVQCIITRNRNHATRFCKISVRRDHPAWNINWPVWHYSDQGGVARVQVVSWH